MSGHESKPAATGIRESTPPEPPPAAIPEPPLPPPWQPITFRGVAAFSQARFGRLLLVQVLVALAVAAAVVWFCHTIWFPRALEAIRALPPTGAIEHRVLTTPRAFAGPLAADAFIAFSVNPDEAASPSAVADVRIEFYRSEVRLCSLLGCLALDYPAAYIIQFNQPELESWWGAWRLTIFSGIVAGVVAFLFASWFFLALCYVPPVWFVAYFKDRRLSLLGSWKIASAALLTPGLMVGLAIVLYGLGIIDLLRLLLFWMGHVPLGWVYLHFAIRQLPRVTPPGQPTVNPFTNPSSTDEKKRDGNPFA